MTIFSIIQPNSLKQRITLFILTPVFLLLISMGAAGFFYTRDILLDQWEETALLKLEQAARNIDKHLSEPKKILQRIHEESKSDTGYLLQDFDFKQLEQLDDVVRVDISIPDQADGTPAQMGMRQNRWARSTGHMQMRYSRMSKIRTASPRLSPQSDSETLSISVDFIDQTDKQIGKIDVVIDFHRIVEQVLISPWWKNNKAYIIDDQNHILAQSPLPDKQLNRSERVQFGLSGPFEKKVLSAMQTAPSGVVYGPGHPPAEIAGFYNLNEAAWRIILIAPGDKVLASLIEHQSYYAFGGIISILIIIIFIRRILSSTSTAIKNVSDAAMAITRGDFGSPLPVVSKDEVGRLTRNFNVMTRQLKERIRLKEDISLAMEVQQNLLPAGDFTANHFEISGTVLYCDETGGDFFDIIELDHAKEKVCVVVGDVVGHGISAALLMTTARALLRSSLHQDLDLARCINHVNRLLCLDTAESGSFVTLFAVIIDTQKQDIEWVRAGHDPAIYYDAQKEKIIELKGQGIVLGLDETFEYSCCKRSGLEKGSCIVIGTDGVWEVENTDNERFGKDPIEKLISTSRNLCAKDLLYTLINDIELFKKGARQEDDITLAVLKFR